MLKLCFFVCHTPLSSLSTLVSYNLLLFFFFQIEAYVVVSICQSSSMYSVEAQDPHSLKRNKSQVCTFPSPLWLFPTVTLCHCLYLCVFNRFLCLGCVVFCLLFFFFNHQQIYLFSTSVSEIHSHFSTWEELVDSLGFINVIVPLNFSLLFNADLLLSFIWLGWYSRANLISAPKHYDSGK